MASYFEDFGLVAELQEIAGENIIESINIEICYYNKVSGGGDWDALDRVLTRNPLAWKSLKNVSLYFNVDALTAWRADKASIRLPGNQLNALKASTAFHFDYKFYISHNPWVPRWFTNISGGRQRTRHFEIVF